MPAPPRPVQSQGHCPWAACRGRSRASSERAVCGPTCCGSAVSVRSRSAVSERKLVHLVMTVV